MHLRCRYVSTGRRLDFKDETKLAVDAEEQRAVLERQASNQAASTPSYHFICEAFFMTAKGLHLGLVKMIQDQYNLARVRLALQHLWHSPPSLNTYCLQPSFLVLMPFLPCCDGVNGTVSGSHSGPGAPLTRK